MVMVRRSLPFRVLCLLLIACVLCCSCLMPYAQAVVVESALLYGAYELIAAILIGCGIIATTSDDARAMAKEVFGWLQSNASAVLDKINGLVAQSLASAIVSGVRVSGEIVDAIKQAVDAFTSVDDAGKKIFVSYPAPPAGFPSFDYIVNSVAPLIWDLSDKNSYWQVRSIEKGGAYWVQTGEEGHSLTFCGNVPHFMTGLNGYAMYADVGLSIHLVDSIDGSTFEYNGSYYKLKYSIGSEDKLVSYRDTFYAASCDIFYESGSLFYSSAVDSVSAPYSGDIVSPSDDYLVRVPDLPDVQTDENGQEVVVYPDLSLNPADHLSDIPKDAAGEVADVPYDTLVDVGTGEAVGEGEGAGEGVENPDIPATDTGVIQSIFDKILDFFDKPSDFKLDFDGFKNLILKDRFPFCIPFDLINSIRVFAASAADFSFDIDLDTSYFSVHHTVDLSPFAVPIAFFRYTCIAFWVWVLITRTRDLMKW